MAETREVYGVKKEVLCLNPGMLHDDDKCDTSGEMCVLHSHRCATAHPHNINRRKQQEPFTKREIINKLDKQRKKKLSTGIGMATWEDYKLHLFTDC